MTTSRASEKRRQARAIDANRADRALGVAAVLLALAWGVAGGYVAHTQVPPNALDLPFENQLRPLVRVLVPEGWAFFTRNPREQRFLPFVRRSDGTWDSARAGPHAQARYLFGLDRRSRTQGVEIGLLQGAIPGAAWESCEDEIATCLARAGPSVHLQNESPAPTLCGTVGLALQEPLPWAWSDSGADETMPSKIVRLDVSC